jgi:flagellar basal-body rod modification protein FlgD
MTIDALTSTPSSSSKTPSAANQLTGSKDEFLKLFMAQLQHQDPMDPKSGADMVAQLAQFSSVEQAQQTNAQLSALTASESSTANASLSSLVGRQCDATAGDIHLDNAHQVPPLDVSANGAIKNGAIVVTDASGKEIRRIAIPPNGGVVQWDGNDASGNPAKEGDYHLSVDAGQTTAAITAKWHGKIDSIELTPNGARLRMGGVLLNPGDITTIGQGAL